MGSESGSGLSSKFRGNTGREDGVELKALVNWVRKLLRRFGVTRMAIKFSNPLVFSAFPPLLFLRFSLCFSLPGLGFKLSISPPHPSMATAAPATTGTGAGSATAAKRKPVFVKVDQLKPGTSGHTLIVKVVSSTTVLQKGRSASLNPRPTRIAECLVGDETGAIVFTARNEQIDLMKPGATVILRNAKIDMFKGSMRLAVDKWGRVEVTEPASFEVKEDNNLSLVEYELVNVVEE